MRLLEIGCFDGRLFHEVEDHIAEYVGIDANWEDGLTLAREKLDHLSDVTLIQTTDPSPLEEYPDGYFTASAALETLEHISPELLGDYLDQVARVSNGYFFVTVPNELGPIFLLKYAAKRLVYGSVQRYSWKEFGAAVLSRADLIERREHKGFDHRVLIREIGRRFTVRSVEGIPKLGLPAAVSPTIGIVAHTGLGQR